MPQADCALEVCFSQTVKIRFEVTTSFTHLGEPADDVSARVLDPVWRQAVAALERHHHGACKALVDGI